MITYQDGFALGGCSFGTFGGIWSGIRPSMYTYQEKYVPPPRWTVGVGPVV